jgi:hypothetical protein
MEENTYKIFPEFKQPIIFRTEVYLPGIQGWFYLIKTLLAD